jgi:pimeloyl-ACP methyl ester carboxylesterase
MSSARAPSNVLYFTERGAGPPLLLVHGLMVTGEMFKPVIEHLATRHRVIVPDLRGHGRSRGLPPPYTAVHRFRKTRVDSPIARAVQRRCRSRWFLNFRKPRVACQAARRVKLCNLSPI